MQMHEVLVRVNDLYAQGMTDKFDILFALGEDGEAAFESHANRMGERCWTKAALLAIVDLVGRMGQEGVVPDKLGNEVREVVRTARDAFHHFPWQVDALVEHAPALYDLIVEKSANPQLCDRLSRRAFTTICKNVVFNR
ncbi:MAG: hypothetical protein HQL36_05420 [Alphaproteobacteria bacterium]|nr:hypothetical protein [Alphaproteobacteria bacterium]MBF0249606.1 hypothetical protein [Alphaproteobacteria bacterium]